MSNLFAKKFHYPVNLQLNILPFVNGYIIWLLGPCSYIKRVVYKPIEFRQIKNGIIKMPFSFYRNYSLFYKIYNKYFLQTSNKTYSFNHIFLQHEITRVLIGFNKMLTLRGVGYKFKPINNKLDIEVGFTHKLSTELPLDSSFKLSRKFRVLWLKNNSLSKLTKYLSTIKIHKPVNIYTLRGIKYRKEYIRIKEGKKRKSF